jgi:hypothetical protein
MNLSVQPNLLSALLSRLVEFIAKLREKPPENVTVGVVDASLNYNQKVQDYNNFYHADMIYSNKSRRPSFKNNSYNTYYMSH